MNTRPIRSILGEILENSIWCPQDSIQFIKELFRTCFEYILYQRTNLDRRYFALYEFNGFFYKNLKKDVRNEFLEGICGWVPNVMSAYDTERVHTLHLVFNDKYNPVNTVEAYSFDFYKTDNVDESIRPLAKNNLVNIAKSLLMAIGNLRSITNVLDTNKVLAFFLLVYKEEESFALSSLNRAIGSSYQNNSKYHVCKTIDLGIFWTGFHEIEISVKYEMANFVRVMFAIMDRVERAQKQYLVPSPTLPESPTSIVDDLPKETFAEVIPLACTSKVWSQCFVNQLIRSLVGSILRQRTNIQTDDFETRVFKSTKYAVLKNYPENLISIKINKLFPHIHKSILNEEVHEIQFIFCKASKPSKSVEVYQFLVKALHNNQDINEKETRCILERDLINLYQTIRSLNRCKLSFEKFLTYFRLHFMENTPLPRYELGYYEINAYHKDDDSSAILYKTKVLGSVSTGFHEVTVITRYDLMDASEYLQDVLHEKYDTEMINPVLDCSTSSEELSDDDQPDFSTTNEVNNKRMKLEPI